MSDLFTYESLRQALGQQPFRFYERVASTQDLARDWALSEPELPAGALVIAEEQTAGRGRQRREWRTPPGQALALSMILRPHLVPEQLPRVTMLGGVAVAATLSPLLGDALALKWPNDVLVRGRKLCGILAEGAGFPEDPRIVVGLGVNVSLTKEQLPVPHATSLALEGVDVSTEDVTVAVLEALHRRLTQWATGDRSLMDDYRRECITIGKPVRVEAPGGDLHGTVADIAPDGRLDLLADDGDRHLISAGDVTHLRRTDARY